MKKPTVASASQGSGRVTITAASVRIATRSRTADFHVLLGWKDAKLAGSQAFRLNLPLTNVWHTVLLILNRRSCESRAA
jgi:hypothetical protein